MLKKTIFEMYPVSALMYLATTTLTAEMLNDIRQACRVDHKDFDLALIKNDNFLNFETSGIPAELRKKSSTQ